MLKRTVQCRTLPGSDGGSDAPRMLDYLYSQGMLLKWSGVNLLVKKKNNGVEGLVIK